MFVIINFAVSKSYKNVVIYKSTSCFANYDENYYVMVVKICNDGTDTNVLRLYLITVVCVCVCVQC